MTTIKVVNEALYSSKVSDVELNLRKMQSSFTGDVAITLSNDEQKLITGDHGAKEYVEEFGFEIVAINARFDLENRNDRDLFRLHCVEAINESEDTWSDVSALHAQDYSTYFDAYMLDNALYDSTDEMSGDTLLVAASQYHQAQAQFEDIMARCADDYFQEN